MPSPKSSRSLAAGLLVATLALVAPACVRAGTSDATRVAAATSTAAGVTVFGDRLAQALAAGLEGGDPGVIVRSYASDDAGLTRADFDAWLDALRDRLKGSRRPAVAVMMVGTNDRRAIASAGSSVEPTDPEWAALYGKRVDAVIAVFREARVPLVWVGLPIVRSEAAAADYVRINGAVRDRTAAAGAAFVDTWQAFSDDGGNYSPVGPDTEGAVTKLRRADGVGFTLAGSRKLASFVEGDLKRFAAPAATETTPEITIDRSRDFDQALQVDINAQIQREAGLAGDRSLARLAPEARKPAVGPVVSLTNPPVATDGRLATASSDAPGSASPASLVARPADTTGSIAAPKPGRADDFSWPKP